MTSLASHMLSLAGIVDLIIAWVLVEAALLARRRQRTGQGLTWLETCCMLGAGFFLMLALRVSLAGAHSAWVCLCLATSGVVHGADLHLRLRHHESARPATPPPD